MFCCYLESNCCVASFLRAVPSALAWTAGNRHGPSAAVLSWDLGSFSGQFCPVVGIRIPAAPQIRAESREGEEARWLAGSSGTRPGPLAPRSLPALCCLVFRSSFSPVWLRIYYLLSAPKVGTQPGVGPLGDATAQVSRALGSQSVEQLSLRTCT